MPSFVVHSKATIIRGGQSGEQLWCLNSHSRRLVSISGLNDDSVPCSSFHAAPSFSPFEVLEELELLVDGALSAVL